LFYQTRETYRKSRRWIKLLNPYKMTSQKLKAIQDDKSEA